MKITHYKNGREYETVEKEERIMIQEGGEWVNAVIYKEVGGEILFVRSFEEMKLKFKEVV